MIPVEQLTNIYDKNWCRKHKKQPIRLLDMLRNRELEIRKPGTHFLSGSRHFYRCFKLECTTNIPSTSSTPIRFTPDGRQLISFNISSHEVQAFWYRGVTSIRTLPNPNAQKLLVDHFSIKIQQHFEANASLFRDVCLITADSKHLIIAYTLQLPEQHAILTRTSRNNESSTTGFTLEHTTFITVDLIKGAVCDSERFEYDSIKASGSIYLVDRLLGVLSTQHQTIHLYKIDETSGSFAKVLRIGQKLYQDDSFYLNSVPSNARTARFFTGFRNRLLAYLYKAHKRAGTSLNYLRSINHYQQLRIHKMQFLGPNIILLRLGSGAGTESSIRKEEDKFFCMFVLYEWQEAEIIAVFNRYSETLFKLYVDFTETFQNGSIVENAFPTTMEHCQLLRQQNHDNIIDALVASSSPESATRVRNRTLNVLPCSGTSIPLFTPLLDAHLFSFDDRLLNCIENGRLSPNTDLKIFCRKTCSPVLSIDFSKYTDQDSPCRVLFHPTDPLVLVTKHFCSDSPMYIFTPRLCDWSFDSEIEDLPGPSSQSH